MWQVLIDNTFENDELLQDPVYWLKTSEGRYQHVETLYWNESMYGNECPSLEGGFEGIKNKTRIFFKQSKIVRERAADNREAKARRESAKARKAKKQMEELSSDDLDSILNEPDGEGGDLADPETARRAAARKVMQDARKRARAILEKDSDHTGAAGKKSAGLKKGGARRVTIDVPSTDVSIEDSDSSEEVPTMKQTKGGRGVTKSRAKAILDETSDSTDDGGPATKKAPARKTAAKKAPAKKASTQKISAKKTPIKKTPAKKHRGPFLSDTSDEGDEF